MICWAYIDESIHLITHWLGTLTALNVKLLPTAITEAQRFGIMYIYLYEYWCEPFNRMIYLHKNLCRSKLIDSELSESLTCRPAAFILGTVFYALLVFTLSKYSVSHPALYNKSY